MQFTRYLRPAALVAVFMALAACEPLPQTAGGGASDAGPVKVALFVPRGSGDAQRDQLGRSLLNAARLAESDLQGVAIDLQVYDTAGDPGTAAAAAQEALANGAEVFVGPLFSTAAASVAPLAAQRGVPVLSFSNNPQIAGGNLYIIGNTFENTARRVVGYAAGQGLTNVGVVHPQGVEGEQARRSVEAAASRFGSQVVAAGSYPLSVDGITATVPGIARQMRGAGANAIVLTDAPTGGLSFVAETLRGSGLRRDAVRFAGLQRWDVSPQSMAQPALAGGWFAAPDATVTQQFINRYRANYGTDPHPLAGLAYDGIAAVGALVSEARGDRRGGPFTEARLTAPGGFAGVGGVFRLTADRQVERALAVYEVVDGAAQVVDPAPRSFGAGGS